MTSTFVFEPAPIFSTWARAFSIVLELPVWALAAFTPNAVKSNIPVNVAAKVFLKSLVSFNQSDALAEQPTFQ